MRVILGMVDEIKASGEPGALPEALVDSFRATLTQKVWDEEKGEKMEVSQYIFHTVVSLLGNSKGDWSRVSDCDCIKLDLSISRADLL